MTQEGHIEGVPTNDHFELGKFVKYESERGNPTIGLVSSRYNPHTLVVNHFDQGFPTPGAYGPSEFEHFEEVTNVEALAHFKTVYDRLEEAFQQGGMEGAIAARRQYHLENVIGDLNEAIRMILEISNPHRMLDAPHTRAPQTGVYVLENKDGLRGVTTNPRMPEEIMEKLLYGIDFLEFFPIVRVYEIPKKGLRHVENPQQVRIFGQLSPERVANLTERLQTVEQQIRSIEEDSVVDKSDAASQRYESFQEEKAELLSVLAGNKFFEE